jgi:hypothetical protein
VFKKLAVTAAALIGLATVAIAPTAAQAANNDGVINSGEFVQWYFSRFNGSFYDEFYGITNYNGKTFRSSGSGFGASVANNSESVANYDSTFRVTFYTATNWSGSGYTAEKYGVYISSSQAWYYATLGSWTNNIESHKFI